MKVRYLLIVGREPLALPLHHKHLTGIHKGGAAAVLGCGSSSHPARRRHDDRRNLNHRNLKDRGIDHWGVDCWRNRGSVGGRGLPGSPLYCPTAAVDLRKLL
jgi:hypothetical protein